MLGEVTEGGRLDRPVARRDRRRRPAPHRRPRGSGLRAAVRPARLAGRPPGGHPRPARRGPSTAEEPARHCCCGWSPRRTWPAGPGSPTSTTGTCSATPRWRCRTTRASSGSTRRPAAASPSRPTATAGSARSTRTRARSSRSAEAYRNVATGRRPAARRHRLPQLRLARGPGRDVAVRRGGPRARRRLPRARRAGDRRQRRASTTRPATSRSTRRRWSACSA